MTAGPLALTAVRRCCQVMAVCGLICFGVLLALGVGAGVAVAAPDLPELSGRVVDNANLLNAEQRSALETELKSIEDQSTDQVAVVTVPSLGGYPIEDYGIALARKWQLGQKGKDNGLILLVAPADRKVRIEVGRRLEPLMTDTLSKLIIQNAILVQFRRGDFAGGIRDGVRDIKAVLLGNAEEVAVRARGGRTPQSDPTVFIHLLVWGLIIAFIVFVVYRQHQYVQSLSPAERRRLQRRGGASAPIFIPGGSGGWSGGSGSGGGWSGGGGGFGGGGASGDW